MGPIQVVVEDGNNLVLEVTPTPNTTVILDRGIAGPVGPMGDGDVDGPASSTDNAVARFDGTTGKLIQNSLVTVSDTGAVAGVTTLAASGAVTLFGGTANGVAFLNSSKVLTTGSALTFDGTNLGVGATSPAARLHVVGNTFRQNDPTGSNGYVIDTSTVTTRLSTLFGGSSFAIRTGGSGMDRVFLDSAGNLGIGTSSPVNKLTLGGGASDVSFGMRTNASGGLSTDGFDITYTTSNNLYFTNRESGLFSFESGGSERMRLDSSGNLGLGVTPSAWGANFSVLQIGNAAVGKFSNSIAFITQNNFADKYIASSLSAQKLQLNNGAFEFYTAPSGTAGNAISFSQAMTLDASGNLGVGTSSPDTKLEVYGATNADQYWRTSAISLYAQVNNTNGTALFGTLTNHPLTFWTNGAERMRLDSSGNLGLGVTPSAWGSSWKAFQIGNRSSVTNGPANDFGAVSNGYNNGTNWIYLATASATAYFHGFSGGHYWYTAPSGTAGNAISFTQAATLTANGEYLVGLTSATGVAKLQVSGAIRTTGFTVATLPAGTVGMRTYVTDALAPSFGATVAGGGAVTIPVFHNGTNWIVA